MSRRITVLAMVLLLVGVASMAGETAWFDKSCEMCKSMFAVQGMMENITCDQYDLSNGVVSVTVVPANYMEKYRAAHAEMDKTVARMQNGEQVKLCGSCTHLGMCFAKGAKQEYVKTKTGDIFLVTASTPELVAELHTWAKKNKEAMKAAKAAM